MTKIGDNQPKILVEFSPEEVTWLADRLHEWRASYNALALSYTKDVMDKGHATEANVKTIEAIEEHKLMKAKIRNRILDKADDQGFGNL